MLSLSQTRQFLRELKLQPKKSLGQNFLVDQNIVQKSLAMAELISSDTVVEIGPGLGTLTQGILERGADLYAVECDGRLCAHLRKSLGKAYRERFHLLQGDAMAFPVAEKPEEKDYKVVANLPYAISTPWMDALLGQAVLPSRLVVLLQREAVERFLAPAGTKVMGPIALFLQSAYDKVEAHPVSSHCFFPAPAVDSVLLSLSLKAEPFRFSHGTRRLLRQLFTQRRKQLGHLMAEHLPPILANAWSELLRRNAYSATVRPEEIPMKMWQQLELGRPSSC
ncbi:MAG: 16S rRNA (adenine(1518)-N(6)/adenine(1519)-N(6))-dimethyltransferase RsmA [Puniceicoccales bacterium]|jgi:16S rRNA (adenine1518-N6/adenine1519-N6)-dimethyltransferase|nr:16S rRNA (adenine(1518)-N(6)/adenine(1519)-N(6))-dimethyltransferase RsmA [Puniceicoccales bacterium]